MERLLTEDEVAERIGRKKSTLQKDRCDGTGCPFIKIGRLVRYRQSDVDAYVAGLRGYRSTAEVTAERARRDNDERPDPPAAA